MLMQANKRLGRQSVFISGDVKIIGAYTIAGKKEGEGPIGEAFDLIMEDGHWGEESWEKSEIKMQREAITKAAHKANKPLGEINLIYSGDLQNQCVSSSFGARELEVPIYGLFGACSTMAESLSLGAMAIDGGFAENVICGTSSHFASAERQFRFPMEYGGQRTPTAQWTVTGAGMAVLSNEGEGPYITHITTGKIIDKGIKDAANMGAAMAPAAVDTLLAHFSDTKRGPDYYDLIVTGDLGKIGFEIVQEMMSEAGYDLGKNYNDCGLMVFDQEKQDVHAGGSGCGCSAIVLCGNILNQLQKKVINNVLFVGTGALMSPTITQQGESIPCIAHAVAISNTKE
jgi:stage V sporulation protein AD